MYAELAHRAFSNFGWGSDLAEGEVARQVAVVVLHRLNRAALFYLQIFQKLVFELFEVGHTLSVAQSSQHLHHTVGACAIYTGVILYATCLPSRKRLKQPKKWLFMTRTPVARRSRLHCFPSR